MRLKHSWTILFAFLIACGNQAIAPSTVTPIPTVTSPTPIPPAGSPTSTFPPPTFMPTITPSGPVYPVITPNAIQIERWNEYEEALALAFFKSSYQPEQFVCEWEILGHTEQEVYVNAYCSGIYSFAPYAASIPTVIQLEDGSVQSAEIPGAGTSYARDIRRMFPTELHERIFDHSISFQGMVDRLRWRRGHPDEPPLIILSSLSTPLTPTVIPWITPDAVQVERWMEYQKALAEQLSYLPPEKVLCEWEFLGRSGNEIYVWAVCGEIWDVRVGLESLVRIDVREDGSVQNAITPGIGGMGSFSDIRLLFPLDVQERYYDGLIHFQELVDHLRLRLRQPYEPPLIVLHAIPTP